MREVILAGRPNSGKSTLYNRIASANQKVGNYAGCTVEKKTASVLVDGKESFLITDLPGIYSLKPNSLDEEVAIRHLAESKETALVVFVLDGNNLQQELTLPLLLKNQGYSIAIAVNMMDEVRANHRILDIAGMENLAGIPFFPIAARSGEGVEKLQNFLGKWRGAASADNSCCAPSSSDPESILAQHRSARANAKVITAKNSQEKNRLLERDKKIDSFFLHPVVGPILFFFVMFVIFQSVFAWAKPLSDQIEAGVGFLQNFSKSHIAAEFLASLISDGVLAGVGSVLVFVPQIAILFFLIGILEYSGYLPRIAYMVDRLMKPYGLEGKVFIPLLSSVACAVPGILATRTIESERRRLITIMISPLMTCSARLPVYTLLISTFIPSQQLGPFSLQGLVMFAMYLLAIVTALFVALVLHKFSFKDRKHLVDFISLPHYRWPNWPELFRYIWRRVFMFLKKAGTIIAAMAILLWALLSFPENAEKKLAYQANSQKIAENNQLSESMKTEQQAALDSEYASTRLSESLGGKTGKFMEPLFKPLGYDWKLTIGILSSLAAREVFVSTLGTVFALGTVDEHSEGLTKILKDSRTLDGKPSYTIATCLSLLVFFAFSLQCVSTIGVARRETNSWKIPLVMFLYMFALAYASAFVVFQAASLFLL